MLDGLGTVILTLSVTIGDHSLSKSIKQSIR